MKSKLFSLVIATLLAACGTQQGETQSFPDLPNGDIPRRRSAVIVVGCTLDDSQLETLQDPNTRHVVSDVVMLCLQANQLGAIAPSDPDSIAAFSALSTLLHSSGYTVSLGLEPANFPDMPYDVGATSSLYANAAWRDSVTSALRTWKPYVDGFELALSPTPDMSRESVTSFVTEIAAMAHPDRTVTVFLPPVQIEPSDVPGGDAFDVATLSESVDHFRLMTLDYSSNTPPGPTLDPGWAVDVYRLAATNTSVSIDVSVPLYGTDFSALGQRSITFNDAIARSVSYGVPVQRGPTGAPHVAYDDAQGITHDLWFDDSYSTILELEAWDPNTLPISVGVTFYGLGAEDPALFAALSARLR